MASDSHIMNDKETREVYSDTYAYRFAEYVPGTNQIRQVTVAGGSGADVVTDLIEPGMDPAYPYVNGDYAPCNKLGVGGVIPLELGGTVAVGDPVAQDAVGRGVVAVGPAHDYGRFREAGVSGDIIGFEPKKY